MIEKDLRIWLARLLISLVLVVNLQCAIAFLCNPADYTPAFELVGIPGEAAIRGFGILFIMWNVPYLVALRHPRNQRVSLYEANAMQFIGLVGETILYNHLPDGYIVLKNAVLRFILFDGIGLVALLAALFLVRKKVGNNQSSTRTKVQILEGQGTDHANVPAPK